MSQSHPKCCDNQSLAMSPTASCVLQTASRAGTTIQLRYSITYCITTIYAKHCLPESVLIACATCTHIHNSTEKPELLNCLGSSNLEQLMQNLEQKNEEHVIYCQHCLPQMFCFFYFIVLNHCLLSSMCSRFVFNVFVFLITSMKYVMLISM